MTCCGSGGGSGGSGGGGVTVWLSEGLALEPGSVQ